MGKTNERGATGRQSALTGAQDEHAAFALQREMLALIKELTDEVPEEGYDAIARLIELADTARALLARIGRGRGVKS